MKTNKKNVAAVLEKTSLSRLIEGFLRDPGVLLEGSRMSEPLRTFVGNIGAIKELLGVAVSTVGKKEKAARKRKKLFEKHQIDSALLVKEGKEELASLYKQRKGLEKDKAGARGDKEALRIIESAMKETNNIIKRYENLMPRAERLVVDFDELCDSYSLNIDSYVRQGQIIMPMVFVYLVTIWDAFVLDTVRNILRVHPQAITGDDAKTGASKAVLWSVGSIEDLRDLLIEEVVQELDHDRKKLGKYFVDYWGIDWKESGIAMDDVVEIRARRDIWVHNKGVVNKQYIDMGGEGNLCKEGEVAQIDGQYFDGCLEKLTWLAIHIHRIAHEKHYAKADIG